MQPDTPSHRTGRLRSLEGGSFRLAEDRYPAGGWLPPHRHEHASLVLVVGGMFTERLGARDESVGPGMALLRRAEALHSDMFGRAGARCVTIDCVDADPDMLGWLPRRSDGAALRLPELTRSGLRLLMAEWDGDAVDRLEVEGLILELRDAASVAARHEALEYPPWVAAAYDRLRREWRSPPTIAGLALEAGVSATVFVRRFRRRYRAAPATVVQLARLEHAVALMPLRDLTLPEIARRSGFSDQSHMGRIFRRMLRRTPAGFRRRLLASSPR